jgi:hypothetical protein
MYFNCSVLDILNRKLVGGLINYLKNVPLIWIKMMHFPNG